MGKIVAPDSFGEISVLQQEAMVSAENKTSSLSLIHDIPRHAQWSPLAPAVSVLFAQRKAQVSRKQGLTLILGLLYTIALPEVTRKLLLHTAQRTYAHLSQDDIRREYVNQETRKEWTDFKKDILHDVIFKKNIRTGQGKWQHSLPSASANRLTKSSMH
jgi:hypothetical protein